MHKIFTFLILATTIPCRIAFADDGMPVKALSAIKMRFPDTEVREIAIGKIRPTNVNDIAVVINKVGQPAANRIVVLRKEKEGSYRIVHETKEINPGGGNYDFDIDIKNHSLFIHTSFPGQSIAESDEYQFNYQSGTFRLIGVSVNMFSHAAEDSEYKYKTSTNLLTGEKNDFIEDVVDSKKRRFEVKTHVPVRPPIEFKDFDFVVDLRAELRLVIGRDFKIQPE
jgi:hypothetical protein